MFKTSVFREKNHVIHCMKKTTPGYDRHPLPGRTNRTMTCRETQRLLFQVNPSQSTSCRNRCGGVFPTGRRRGARQPFRLVKPDKERMFSPRKRFSQPLMDRFAEQGERSPEARVSWSGQPLSRRWLCSKAIK